MLLVPKLELGNETKDGLRGNGKDCPKKRPGSFGRGPGFSGWRVVVL